MFWDASPVILTGPSLVGKSVVAETWADMLDGQLVNADKYYLYAGEYFMLGIGLKPGAIADGRRRHLYGCLNPFDPLPSNEAYLALASEAIDTTHAEDAIAIVEGCSFSFAIKLIGRYGLKHAMRMSGGDEYERNLKRQCFHSYCSLVRLGLYEETERALEAGLVDTYPMSSLIYRHSVQFVNGSITESETTRRVVEDWVNEIKKTNEQFDTIGGLTTVPVI